MKTLHHKLVRDRIPEIIEEAGKTHQTAIIDGEHLRGAAFKKLQEEVMEFIENPCAEEAADIMEILHFILGREGITETIDYQRKNSRSLIKGAKLIYENWFNLIEKN